uniref:Tubulin--tyrosine ligase-like protein 9 n=1 Tax=Naja naja TaxID=35670 RepID=A0A8C6XV46_NAJNA
ILDVLQQRPGWVEVKDEGEWDFYWCDVRWLQENFDHTYMDEHVRISHFRNHYEVGKVGSHDHQELVVKKFESHPWSPPPPVARSQGRGIFLFRKLKDVIDWRKVRSLLLLPSEDGQPDAVRPDDQKDDIPVENYVAQRYIENPYLIGGRKFDLRVYVLVMSYLPLKAWLYRDGFARFSNTRFTLNTLDDQYIHLTNVAVQKTAPDYDPEKGCKWMIQQFRLYLTAKHGAEAAEMLFSEMDNIFIKSLQSVQKVIISDKHCFELYGYDILIDQNLKPWLLEVNASPSLTASSQEDHDLKTRILEDTLNIVDMEGRLTGKEKRIGGFDLMWNDGPVSREDANLDTPMNGFVANTHLGMAPDGSGEGIAQLQSLIRLGELPGR